jgi:hypothetical protein
MKRLVTHRAVRRLSACVLSALFGLLWVAGPVLGQSVTFGTPSAVSKFGASIVFTQPYSGASVNTASILIKVPDDAGPSVFTVSRIGSGSLVFTMDTSSGTLFPNTPVTANFEVVLADGTSQEGPVIHVVYDDDRFTWKTKTGKLVRLHYIDASDAFAQQMLTLADGGVTKAATLFGVSESQPIDYYVYPSQSVFQQGLNQPDTVGGVAMPSFRTCYSIVAAGDTAYAAQVMPHEPTHVVFADATGNPYHDPPRWLNEGFAQYVSQGYDAQSRQEVSRAVSNGTLTSLLALTDFFPLDSQRIYLAYAEAVSAVDFMVRKYGQPAIPKLAKAYAGGASDDEAFTAAFGVDVATFNSAWLADNGVTPVKYGPQPAPTGPLPPGWNGSSGTVTTPQPTTAGGPAGTPSTSSGGQNASTLSDNTIVYLLAGIMAAAGLVLIGLAIALVATSRRQPLP